MTRFLLPMFAIAQTGSLDDAPMLEGGHPMADLTDQQAHDYLIKLLTAMSKAGGSDLFIASDFPPSMKSQGEMQPMTTQKLTGEVTRQLAHSLMNENQRAEFA